MAEMLIKAADNTHPDPDTNECHCWKQDDIVVVVEDGHVWGGKEGPPTFYIVSLPGVAKADVIPYCQPWMNDENVHRRSLYSWDDGTQEFVNKDTGVRTHKDNI